MKSHRAAASTERVVELERRIAADPETVFAYFTDPDRYRLWQGVDAELDPRPGGAFRLSMTGHSHQVVEGQYLDLEPPRRLVFTWGYQGNAGLRPGDSTVEVVLVPDGDGTLLKVRHGRLPSDNARRFHAWGWELSLERLAAVAAGGDPGPNPFADF